MAKERFSPPPIPEMERPEVTELPKFSPEAWDYTPQDVGRLIDILCEGNFAGKENFKTPDEFRRYMRKVLEIGGGKAFGLILCELVVANWPRNNNIKISVPEWRVLGKGEVKKFNPQNYKVGAPELQYLLRTSTATEDWLSEKSGEGVTLFLDNYNQREHLKKIKESEQYATNPFVLQKKANGIGLVVDIAYSLRTNSVVNRVSAGNKRALVGRGYQLSSATDDGEAAVGLWDEKGKPLLPFRVFAPHISLYSDKEFVDNVLVARLFETIKKIGIDFGVQLELVVDLNSPHEIALVQIRPTPGQVYRKNIDNSLEIRQRSKEVPLIVENLLAKSAIVNGAFDFTVDCGNGAVFFSEEENRELGQEYGEFLNPPIVDEFVCEENDAKRKDQKIAFFDFDRFVIRYDTTDQIYYREFKNGYRLFVNSQAIIANSHHGMMHSNKYLKNNFSFLNQYCGMLSLPRAEIDKIKKAVKARPGARLRVVSDGLVAGFYIAE